MRNTTYLVHGLLPHIKLDALCNLVNTVAFAIILNMKKLRLRESNFVILENVPKCSGARIQTQVCIQESQFLWYISIDSLGSL